MAPGVKVFSLFFPPDCFIPGFPVPAFRPSRAPCLLAFLFPFFIWFYNTPSSESCSGRGSHTILGYSPLATLAAVFLIYATLCAFLCLRLSPQNGNFAWRLSVSGNPECVSRIDFLRLASLFHTTKSTICLLSAAPFYISSPALVPTPFESLGFLPCLPVSSYRVLL